MTFIFSHIMEIAVGGLVLALVANVVLLFGRKSGITVWQVVSSGHLSAEERRGRFHRKFVLASNVLGYTGISLFLFSIIMIVTATIRAYY